MRLSIITIALCMGMPLPARAQDSLSPPVATRVRITLTEAGESRQVTGRLLALNHDSIVFSPGRQALSIDRVIRLEISDGRQRHPFAGLFIGAAVGGVVLGTTAAIAASRRTPNPYVRDEFPPSTAALLGGTYGATLGATVGMLVGSLKIYERWTPVKIPR